MFDGTSVRLVATIVKGPLKSETNELQEIVLLSHDESEDENLVLSSDTWIARNYLIAASSQSESEQTVVNFFEQNYDFLPFLVLDYGFDSARILRLFSKEWSEKELPAREGTVWPLDPFFVLASLDVQLVNKYFDLSSELGT